MLSILKKIPNLRFILPVSGTIGLILIVMEASLEIKLERNKAIRLMQGIISAIVLFVTILTITVAKVWEK